MTKTTGAISLAIAGALSIAFFLAFRSGPSSPSPVSSNDSERLTTWLRDLEDRLDAVERSVDGALDRLERRRPAPADSAGGAVAEQPREQEIGSGLDALRSALRDLTYRVQGLEEDPINRGYAFLQSQNAELRRQGIRSLQRLARFDPAARDAIRQMLNDENGRVRREALEALGELGDRESAPLIAKLLGDSDADVRRGAIERLEQFRAADAGPAIAQLLGDPAEGVRAAAADALGSLAAKDAVGPLLEALNDKNDEVRGEAIASLGEIGARDAIPRLRSIWDAGPGRHRARLIRALRSLGDDGPFQQELRSLSETALGSQDPRARERALETLSWLAPREAQDVFRRAREDPDERVRRQAENGLRRREEER